MPYDPNLVQPMRDDMTAMDVEELLDAAQVEAFMGRPGSKLIFVNSVCGCAAGQARPGLRLALQSPTKPDHVGTVFAGQDLDATTRARAFLADVPPSSPSVALFKGEELVHFVPRHLIESRDAPAIAHDLVEAFDQHCAGLMGTFHDGRGEFHGMTVVVDLKDSRLFVGRCDTVTSQGVVLFEADMHDESVAGPAGELISKADYLRKAARIGFWKKLDRVVVPAAEVASIQKLGELL